MKNLCLNTLLFGLFFFFQAEDGIRDDLVTGVQTCALPISPADFRISSMQDEMMMRQQQQVRQYYLHGPFLLLINLIHIVPV